MIKLFGNKILLHYLYFVYKKLNNRILLFNRAIILKNKLKFYLQKFSNILNLAFHNLNIFYKTLSLSAKSSNWKIVSYIIIITVPNLKEF